jgi:hypothetical protein
VFISIILENIMVSFKRERQIKEENYFSSKVKLFMKELGLLEN